MFVPYEPKDDVIPGVLYLQDESGKDWYEWQKTFKKKFAVVYDATGRVVSWSDDVSTLWPMRCNVIGVNVLPAGFAEGVWQVVAGKIVPFVDLAADARLALADADLVALRYWKSGQAWPSEWRDYESALRKIIADPSGVAKLPDRPEIPSSI